MTWLAGVDGCPGGFLVALVWPVGGEVRLRLLPGFADIARAEELPAVIAVDMPIGLPDRIGPGGRGPEQAVRPLLGGRQSSVFSVPSRAAVYTADYREACRVALTTSDPPRQVSKQLFHIAAKIREVDGCLRTDLDLRERVFEVHPEVAFWRLNGERALDEPKKVKGRPHAAGLALRRKLLIASGIPAAAAGAVPPRGAGPDDLVDALACAVIARRIYLGEAAPFPSAPGRDCWGLRMAIWA